MGEPIDSAAIFVIVFLNAVVGTVQEIRTERAIRALRELAAPVARVRREGETRTLPAIRLVPGDIVLLEAGSVVPADLRLGEVTGLQVDEATVTGESVPVEKQSDPIHDPGAPLGDRVNMAYKGTLVTRGRGAGVAVATGAATELGRIAALLGAAASGTTPLQKRLSVFSRRLAVGVLGICAILYGMGLLRGEEPIRMLLTAVSLAVAAVPEGLPAIVTLALALGAYRMGQRKALVRRLPSAETLGSVTTICADKTGTLTRNEMRLEKLWLSEERAGLSPRDRADAREELLVHSFVLNNDAGTKSGGRSTGDPMEVALLEAARSAGYDAETIGETWTREGELPFDAERKRMSTLHRTSGGVVVLTKGAPEAVLPACVGSVDVEERLDPETILDRANSLATEGYRVLAFARRSVESLPADLDPDTVERDLEFIGLAALIDPPREEAPPAVADCLRAGIRPVMITGDHPGTAVAIAKRIGLPVEGESAVLIGSELDRLSDDELRSRVGDVRVYARVDPRQKIRIVSALQESGEFVAMTGDGVNDAPALRQADIGVAMGLKGTDVAREAADMVLLDDNFATIVGAVREGRRIFDNIRKFIKYTLTSNSGEIWTLLAAPLLGLPIPLLPLHILWINLVTDGLPGLAFAAEPEERGIMTRPPRPPRESVFAHGLGAHLVGIGLFIGALTLASQAWSYHAGNERWQTIVFTVLTVSQLFHALAIRSETESLFSAGVMGNRHLLGAVLLTFLLQLLVIYTPFLQSVFKTHSLSLGEVLLCVGISSLVLAAVEAEKWCRRRWGGEEPAGQGNGLSPSRR